MIFDRNHPEITSDLRLFPVSLSLGSELLLIPRRTLDIV